MANLRSMIGAGILVLACAGAADTAPLAPTAAAPPAAETVVLAPHRAFYNLKLARSSGGRAVNDVNGRISYEFSGSTCEGGTNRHRISCARLSASPARPCA